MQHLGVGLSSKTYAPYAALGLAQERGFFRDVGIDVELVPFLGGGYNQQGFAEGRVDIAHVNPANVVLAQDAGISEIGFGTLTLRPDGYHVLVRTEAAIRHFDELDGGRMGATASGSSTAIFPIWAASRSRIAMTIVHLPADRLVDGLLSGAVDAITVWAPLSYRLIASGRARSIMDLGAALDPCVPACWVARRETARDDPRLLRGFLDATGRGIRALQADRAAALRRIAAFTGEEDERVLAETFDRTIMNLRPDGFVSREALTGVLRAAVAGGIIRAMPDLDAVFTWAAFAEMSDPHATAAQDGETPR